MQIRAWFNVVWIISRHHTEPCTATRDRSGARHRYRLNSRLRLDPKPDFVVQTLHTSLIVFIQFRIDGEQNDVLGVEADFRRQKVANTTKNQAGADQQNDA